MGNVFKKTVTRPLPPNAEIITRQGVRLARWRDAKGKTKTAPVTTAKDGAERIRDESSTYVARYRDGDGIGRRSLDRMPGQDSGSKRSRRPGAESRASAVRVAHAGRSANRRAPGDADRRARLVKLLDVARRRPLLDALTVRTGNRKGQAVAKVKPDVRRTARSARPRASFDLQGASAHWPEIERTGDTDCRATPARRPSRLRRTRRGRRDSNS